MGPDISGLSMNHEDGFEALCKRVQFWSVSKPGKVGHLPFYGCT
jgi:hypothetical protein